MARQIKGLLYFYAADFRFSITIFSTILMAVLVVSLAFAYFLYKIDNGVMAFSLTVPMYIYCAILGFLTVKEAVPFAIKMGATRKNMFISLGIFFLALSSALAVAGSILQEVVMGISSATGFEAFSFLHLAQLMDNNWYTRILIDSCLMFFLLSIMFLLGLFFYRYGMAGGGSVLGFILVVILGGVAQGWLMEFIVDVFKSMDTTLFIKMFLIGIVVYAISWMFIRNITTVNVK